VPCSTGAGRLVPVAVDGDPVDRAGGRLETDPARPAAIGDVVIRGDLHERPEGGAGVRGEQRVEARAGRVDRDGSGRGRLPAVPDGGAAGAAGVVRLAGLLRGARGGRAQLAGRACERLCRAEGVVRGSLLLLLRPVELQLALLGDARRGVPPAVDGDLVDGAGERDERDLARAVAAGRVVVRHDRGQRGDARSRVDPEERVEVGTLGVDGDGAACGRLPAVPDGGPARIAGVVRLAALLGRADIRPGHLAVRAGEVDPPTERVVERRRRRRRQRLPRRAERVVDEQRAVAAGRRSGEDGVAVLTGLAGEGEPRPVGRPDRARVVRGRVRDPRPIGSVGVHRVDVPDAVGIGREGDPAPARRPVGAVLVPGRVRDLLEIRAVRPDPVDVVLATFGANFALKDDPGAVGRPGRGGVVRQRAGAARAGRPAVRCQCPQTAAVGVGDEDVVVEPEVVDREDEPGAVGRPVDAGDALAGHAEQHGICSVGVLDADLLAGAAGLDECEAPPVGRPGLAEVLVLKAVARLRQRGEARAVGLHGRDPPRLRRGERDQPVLARERGSRPAAGRQRSGARNQRRSGCDQPAETPRPLHGVLSAQSSVKSPCVMPLGVR